MMLRDGFIALQELTRSQWERQQEEVWDSSSEDSMDMEQAQLSRIHEGPVECIKGRDFEAVGRILHPFWYSPQHGRGNLRLAKKEVKRWERSIAFLDNEVVPEVSESAVIEDILELASRMLKIENMAAIRTAVTSLFEPLRKWSTAVIRTHEEHNKLHYALARATVRISKVLIEAGLHDLNDGQQGYITECHEASQAYIIHIDNHALLGDDDFSDDEDEASSKLRFQHLVRSKAPGAVFAPEPLGGQKSLSSAH